MTEKLSVGKFFKNTKIRDAVPVCLTALALFALAFLFCMNSDINIFNPNGETATDSSVFKLVAIYMDNGMMPYKDTFDHKGPLIYIYNWLGLQISYYRGIWVIEVCSLFATFCVFYRTARLVCGRLSSILAVFITATALFTYFDGGNMTEEYAMLFIAAALYIFMDYFLNDRITKMRLVINGFCFAAVLMLRANMIAVWIVFCIAVLIKVIKDKKPLKLVEFVVFFILGALILLIPIFVWLIANGAFGNMIEDYLIFSFKYSARESDTFWFNRYDAVSSFINDTFVLAALIVSGYSACRKRDLLHVSYFICILVTLALMCMGGTSYPHYGMVLVPLLVYPFAVLLAGLTAPTACRNAGMAVAGLFVILCVLPSWIDLCDTTAEYIRDMDETEWTSTAGQIAEIVVYNTDEDDRITVYGNSNIIYVLSGRLSASRYSYQSSLVKVDPDIYDEYFAELSADNPAIIVVTTRYGEGDEEYERMMEFIEEYGYTQLDVIDGYQIFKQ